MKHIDKTLQEIRNALEHQNNAHAKEQQATVKRVDTLEKRVDRIYWLWSAVVFVGSPVMVLVTKYVMALIAGQ